MMNEAFGFVQGQACGLEDARYCAKQGSRSSNIANLIASFLGIGDEYLCSSDPEPIWVESHEVNCLICTQILDCQLSFHIII